MRKFTLITAALMSLIAAPTMAEGKYVLTVIDKVDGKHSEHHATKGGVTFDECYYVHKPNAVGRIQSVLTIARNEMKQASGEIQWWIDIHRDGRTECEYEQIIQEQYGMYYLDGKELVAGKERVIARKQALIDLYENMEFTCKRK